VLAPTSDPSRGRYDQLRGTLALPVKALRDTGGGFGLNPALGYLHQRYARGEVAFVQGVGTTDASLSHFDAVVATMSASPDLRAHTGWLGRYLDGVPGSSDGLSAISVGQGIPLHLIGQNARATAIGPNPTSFPQDTRSQAMRATIQAFANEPTGLRQQGDDLAAVGRDAITNLGRMQTAYNGALSDVPVVRDLTLAARVINADVGARVVSVETGGYDTHAAQVVAQNHLLSQLDVAIETFFANLAPAVADRVTLLAVSEFGRRPQHNGSFGSDHGTANLMFLAGRKVRGGLHAAAPSLDNLDSRGNLIPMIDFRSVYASVLERWLGGDARQVLGARYDQLDLFR
jgi:uncharacterized protein (DUF1501 family)